MMRRTEAIVLLILLCTAPAFGADTRPADSGERGLEALDFREVIRKAKNKVFPAVVFVKCLRDSHEQGKKTSEEVMGSGVIMTPEGELLTNWHVVDKATEVRCLLSDGRPMDAKVLGSGRWRAVPQAGWTPSPRRPRQSMTADN